MAQHIGTQPLHTPRLLLRRFTVDDAEAMYHNWACDPRVARFLSWPPHRDVEVTRQVLTGWVRGYEGEAFYSWGIVFEDRLIGSISTPQLSLHYNHCEVGYCIAHDCWGKGILTEALQAVLEELLLHVGIHRVYARHDVENPASGRVMQKCGMVLEGRLREHYQYPDGRVSDALLYGILDREFRELSELKEARR